MKITSLEGFECGTADRHERRSGAVSTCPPVTVNPPGSLSDRARNGHAQGRDPLLRRSLHAGGQPARRLSRATHGQA